MDDSVRLGLKEDTREQKLRGFGTGLSVVLAIFTVLSWRKHGHAMPYYFVGATVGAFLSWFAPSSFGPVYGPWMKAAGFLAEINTYLITGLIYFFIITPYSFMIRLFGSDPLAREGAREGTDWLTREKPADYRGYENTF
jgi:hypothetical protein